ncbi:hypothetical protein HETIRDRAFT_435012 [Heterobasidion irregulare TC 32-1]|uniref:MARVEL domain-containing protein n=1 Tax=Heterobasidion irregulare (strain TC 32-1) TaxID=747525 RepID=W4K3C5_HETIT|nr:uncharacterized protein HETIRDRAFT_435012 [Heterobasidion irregulare TC 32-1]ETW79581.1 hypothetical protein HETIRDRAFT_435012 [Heterobasidion irregulare TC 32-1]
MAFLPPLRIFLYCALWVFSVVLLGLTAARIHYTTHLAPRDPLNHGRSFYDPIVAELLVTTILTILWAPHIALSIAKGRQEGILNTFAGELLGNAILFLLWIVGAAISTSFWGDLGWCQQYQPCRILSALVAFAWLGWISLLFLIVLSLIHCVKNDAFGSPLHGRSYPRDSTVYTATDMRQSHA